MGFREKVYALVARIPRGRVVSYGQVAAWCGSPRAARLREKPPPGGRWGLGITQ